MKYLKLGYLIGLLSLGIMLGCGSSGDLGDLTVPPVPEQPIQVKGGKDGITPLVSQDRLNVRYLGEIENKGLGPFCFIDISFNTLGKGGNPIDAGFARDPDINGYTLTLLGNIQELGVNPEVDSCLLPGQVGSFETNEVNLTEAFHDFEFRLCFKNDMELCPAMRSDFVQSPRVQLEPLISLDTFPNIDGMTTFRARVQNSSTITDIIPYDIRVLFTMLNVEGKVIDTQISGILNGGPCDVFNINPKDPSGMSCLTSGSQTLDFAVETNVPFSEFCGNDCYYVRIYRSECVLVGNSCSE